MGINKFKPTYIPDLEKLFKVDLITEKMYSFIKKSIKEERSIAFCILDSNSYNDDEILKSIPDESKNKDIDCVRTKEKIAEIVVFIHYFNGIRKASSIKKLELEHGELKYKVLFTNIFNTE